MYTDYAYYLSTFGGSDITSDLEFTVLERKAALHIDRITYNRLHMGQSVTDAVKMAVCAVADTIKQYSSTAQAAITAAGLKSENNDGYSVSYQDSETAQAAIESAMTESARDWLIYTGLMDRSVCV